MREGEKETERGKKGKESRRKELLSSFTQIGLVPTTSSGASLTLTPL